MENDSPEQQDAPAEISFADILNEFERSKSPERKAGTASSAKRKGKGRPAGPPPRRGTVVGVSADFVLVDYGDKSEGVIPVAELRDSEGNLIVKVGDSFDVAITGFDSKGMATLSHRGFPATRLGRLFPRISECHSDCRSCHRSGEGRPYRRRGNARLPAGLRSGVRETAEMEKLVGQDIRCRIIKLDIDEEDVVVDRRSVLEEEASQLRQNTLATLKEGAVVRGTVRSLATYGAFVDIGGLDGLLHVGDISWSRVSDPATELAVGDVLDVRVLKLDAQSGRISLGLKQMSGDPWLAVAEKLKPGDRITGEVTRMTDFGAFIEVTPGVEGMIHVSEMSWTRRIRRPEDLLKVGERVEAVVLKVTVAEGSPGRLSLGLKQVLGNPWTTIAERYPVGKIVEGKVTRLAKFGAFVEVEEGIEGMVHVSEFTNEKRIEHPGEFVKVGQTVRAAVLSTDAENKRLKLGMKQLEATTADKFAEDAAVGDRVSGRIIQVRGNTVTVQLGEGVEGVCIIETAAPASASPASGLSLAAQLEAAWKGGLKSSTAAAVEPYFEGQVRAFTIKSMDTAARKIELMPA